MINELSMIQVLRSKNFCPKNVKVKKLLGQKNWFKRFRAKKFFDSKKIGSKEKYWVKKNVGKKIIWAQKNYSSNNILCP